MIESIIAAAGMCADGVAEGMYAVRHKFSARAASAAYAIGALLCWFFGAVTPITFTVESITVATRSAKTRPQIMYIVALSAIPSILLGITGMYSTFVDLLNTAVIGGIIAGVGIILTGVGVHYVRDKPAIAGSSTLAGVVAYLLTENLVWVIVASVVIGTAACIVGRHFGIGEEKEPEKKGEEEEGAQGSEDESRFGLIRLDWKELFSKSVLIGAFSVFALRTGAVVSYTLVNADIAGTDPNLDGVTLMAGLGSLASALLGGAPIETTPAPMSAAPMPVFSTTLFMAMMALITFFGLVRKIGRYIPLEAIAGFLIVLGIFVILPQQLPQVMENPLPGAAALAVTALSNPFYGIVSGELIVLLLAIGSALGMGIGGK
jgi:adenine/guanine/hypoxanthine permease